MAGGALVELNFLSVDIVTGGAVIEGIGVLSTPVVFLVGILIHALDLGAEQGTTGSKVVWVAEAQGGLAICIYGWFIGGLVQTSVSDSSVHTGL